ncbi:MAG: hypothetical protein ACXVFU_16230, partial [Nocardioidaceae bacterium]
MTFLPVALAASAAAVAATGRARPGRVGRVLPRPPGPGRPVRTGLPPWLVRSAGGLAGLALALLVGGSAGLALGVGAALLGPRLLDRLEAGTPDAAEVAADLPLALDLLAACLAGGATPAA